MKDDMDNLPPLLVQQYKSFDKENPVWARMKENIEAQITHIKETQWRQDGANIDRLIGAVDVLEKMLTGLISELIFVAQNPKIPSPSNEDTEALEGE